VNDLTDAERLAEVMAPVRHVLLDFDGPVCSVFGELPAAEVARRLAESIDADLPTEDVGTDPLALLSVIAERDRSLMTAAEVRLRELEVEAVLTAPITPGVVDALQAFRDAGRAVTIVSNNSAAAVRRFLDDHDLDGLVTTICSREQPDPALLKPSPYLLHRAMHEHGTDAGECLMIGDSVTDVDAAASAGVTMIGFANRLGKDEAMRRRPVPPASVFVQMTELALAVPLTPSGQRLSS
jgi:HAD superfamily hydrolase (TIGR01662 family)